MGEAASVRPSFSALAVVRCQTASKLLFLTERTRYPHGRNCTLAGWIWICQVGVGLTRCVAWLQATSSVELGWRCAQPVGWKGPREAFKGLPSFLAREVTFWAYAVPTVR